MSVIVIGKFKADPAVLEKVFTEKSADFIAVSNEGKSLGALHHRFLAGDGEVIVLDEWDSAEAFQKFFENNTKIPEILQAAGVSAAPEFSFYEAMDSPDRSRTALARGDRLGPGLEGPGHVVEAPLHVAADNEEHQADPAPWKTSVVK